MVSVIIPVYNGEMYIQKSIRSCFNENYINLEIIVVDDGSVDNTRDKVMELKDERIKYFYIENHGQAFARNYGITKSSGEYIALLDADDENYGERLKKQMTVLEKNKEIYFVYNDAYIINENSEIISEFVCDIDLKEKEDLYAYTMFRQNIPVPGAMMIKKECFETIKYPEECRFAEDYKFSLNLIEKYKGTYIKEFLYLYRKHNGNTTNRAIEQARVEKEIVEELGIDKIKSHVEKTNFIEKDKKILLGKIFLKIKYYKEAKEIFESIKDKDEMVFFYLGNIYYELDELEKAKEMYKKGIFFKDTLAETWNNLGVVYHGLKKQDKAKENFYKALKINCDYMDAKYNLINENNEFRITEKELRKRLMVYK